MIDTVLSVKDLRVNIGGRSIVHGVSFEIPKGECCALVGESGSGKTLTALALCNLLPEGGKFGGEITFSDGRRKRRLDMLTEREWRQVRGSGISMVLQDPAAALTPTMKVETILGESLRAHMKLSRREVRLRSEEALSRVGIAREAMGRYPHAFSGGQRQRIALAAATVCSPALLIADEPTTALDVLAQERVMEIFAKIAQGGASVLLITHNLALCERFCSRVCVMHDGVLVESGRTAEVFASPSHPYTRSLMRCVPVPGRRGRLWEMESPTPGGE